MASNEDTCHINGNHMRGLPPIWEVSRFTTYDFIWAFTAGLVAISVILSFSLVYAHLRNYNAPDQQRYIVRILFMVPIYSVASWLSLRYYWLSVFFDLVRDCYEAVVVYSLFLLMVEYMGGYETAKDTFGEKAKQKKFRALAPCCCFRLHAARWMLRLCKRLMLQFVFLRPATAFVAVGLHAASIYCPGNFSPHKGFLWVTLTNTLSISFAMFSLVQFYLLVRQDIQDYKPGSKFLAVKFVVFLSFWQGIAISLLARTNLLTEAPHWTMDNLTSFIQNSMVCVEMVAAALWHIHAFSYKGFVEQGKKTSVRTGLVDVINQADVWRDFVESYHPRSYRRRKYEMLEHRQDDAGGEEGGANNNNTGKGEEDLAPSQQKETSRLL
eukprot:TRINITY_DN1857_c0_g1_i4.p1 TRINITY_DN1857_c0_g1~~TRINITY_DN1857_c0_g1_i4.p1  ORF type:complete len:382 (-),score=57.21 TRINITY_DN1857_c0_g1_i4:38-1183(-)